MIILMQSGVEVLVAGGPNTAQAEIFSPAGVAWRKAATLAHTDYGPAMALVEGVPTVMGGYQAQLADIISRAQPLPSLKLITAQLIHACCSWRRRRGSDCRTGCSST